MTAPKWARALVRWFAPKTQADDLVGDLEEAHRARVQSRGRLVASLLTTIEAVDVAVMLLRKRSNRGGGEARRFPRLSWIDVKLGARMFIKYPGLTLVGCFALSVSTALGAGYFELLNDFFHPRLPFDDQGRIVRILNIDRTTGETAPDLLQDALVWRNELASIEDFTHFRPLDRNLVTGDGRSEIVDVVETNASAFRLIPDRPVIGRTLLPEDEQPGAPAVVVIGFNLWQSRFAGDQNILGRGVRLGAQPYTVVGVMPKGFSFPVNHELWVPWRTSAASYQRGQGPAIGVAGRLAPGATIEGVQAQLTAISARLSAEFPATNERLRTEIAPYLESYIRYSDPQEMRFIFYGLNLFFVGFIGVCCANVATLVFARTATREGELALRTALGANRGRIVTQLFAEALVLTSSATFLGLLLTAVSLRWFGVFVESMGATLPFWWDTRLSATTMIYGMGLAVFAAAIVGIVPALKATGQRLQDRMKLGGASGTGGSRLQFGRLWTGVIVAQVGLTVLFLSILVSIGWNGYIGRYLPPELTVPSKNFLAMRIKIDEEPGYRARFQTAYLALERRLKSEPGIAAVAYAERLPENDAPRFNFEIDGVVPSTEPGGDRPVARTIAVGPGFFGAFAATVLAGRDFLDVDVQSGRDVAVVDERFASGFFGGRNVVGQRVREVKEVSREPAGPWLEIVGVVKDLTRVPDKAAEEGVVYRLVAPGEAYPFVTAVRVAGDAGPMATRVSAIAVDASPELQVGSVKPIGRDQGNNAQRVLFKSVLRALLAVAVVVLLLSAAGVYSLMAFTVARRTREIGIRVALGADSRRVMTSTFSRGLKQIGLGVLAGSVPGTLLIAYGAPEVAEGAGPLVGSIAIAAIALFIMAVGFVACFVPARRALHVEPIEALRTGE